MIKVPDYITQFANICKIHSKIYVVGGYIRDSLLNIPSNDIDLCGNIKIEQLQNILVNSNFKIASSNKTFGTAKIKFENEVFEYTTFRKDIYTSNGKHTPKKVEFVTTLHEDAKRRDFTVNCIYYDILENKLIDPTNNGLLDIKNKVIQTVLNSDNTLKNDGERILRMIKLKVKYGFNINPQTLKSAVKYQNNINDLSKKTIEKFVIFTNKLTSKQKQQVKELLNSFNANQIASLIV